LCYRDSQIAVGLQCFLKCARYGSDQIQETEPIVSFKTAQLRIKFHTDKVCDIEGKEVLRHRGGDKSLARIGRKKLMFPSEWRDFISAPCLAGKKKNLDDSSRLDVVEIGRVPYMLSSLFLVGLRTYQPPPPPPHPIIKSVEKVKETRENAAGFMF